MPKNDYVLSIDCDWVGSPSQYQDLLSYFTEKVKDVEEVYFSGDHQFHYPHIPSNTILVNIDHHHDMGYKDFQQSPFTTIQPCNLATSRTGHHPTIQLGHAGRRPAMV